MQRISKEEYYLKIAEAVVLRGTCKRRNYGAVLVKNDEIVATGYTGSPRGEKNCIEDGVCIREQLGCKPGERYELCTSVHAEQNCLLSASRFEAVGSTLYLIGVDVASGKFVDARPCKMCKRLLINAGVSEVIARNADGSYTRIDNIRDMDDNTQVNSNK